MAQVRKLDIYMTIQTGVDAFELIVVAWLGITDASYLIEIKSTDDIKPKPFVRRSHVSNSCCSRAMAPSARLQMPDCVGCWYMAYYAGLLLWALHALNRSRRNGCNLRPCRWII